MIKSMISETCLFSLLSTSPHRCLRLNITRLIRKNISLLSNNSNLLKEHFSPRDLHQEDLYREEEEDDNLQWIFCLL